MRWFLILMVSAVITFLVGCNFDNPDFPVVLMKNMSLEDVVIKDNNSTMDRISFIMANADDVDLDCSVIFSMLNSTNSSSKRGYIGILRPGEEKKASLDVEMFTGETEFSLKADCRNI